MEKSENFTKLNATTALYSFAHPALGSHIWDIRTKKSDKVTLVLRKNLGFQLFSPKTRRRKHFSRQKTQPWSITTLSMELSNKQTDPTIAFVEK